MHPQMRRALVITIVIVAAVAIPSTTLYALGWRVSLENRSIVKTGALAVFPYPYGVTVMLEGGRSKTISAISPKEYFANLLPASRDVSATREGFVVWQKEALIESGRTLVFPFAQLWPERLDAAASRMLSASVFLETAPKQDLLFFAEAGAMRVLALQDLTTLYSSSDVVARNAVWANESPRAIVELNNNTNVLLDLENKKEPRLVPLPTHLSKARLRGDGKVLVAFSKHNLLALDLTETPSQARTIMRNARTFGWSGNNIIALDQQGGLWSIGSESPENRTQLMDAPVPVDTIDAAIITHEGNNAVHEKNGALWLIEPGETKPQKAGDTVWDFEFSPSGEKVLVRTQNEVRVRFLKERMEQPLRAKGEETLLLRTTNPVLDASFAPGEEHVIVSTAGEIRIFEIDERGGRKSATVGQELIHAVDVDLRTKSLLVAFPDGRLVRYRIPVRPAINVGGAIGL